MLTLTWETINTNAFVGGVVKLNRSTALDAKNSYRIGRIFQACDKAMRECAEKEGELRKKYCKLDEQGNPTTEFKDDESKIKFEGEFKAVLQSNSATIKVHKLEYTAVGQVKGLTGEEMVAMESIVSGIPEVA